MELTHTYFRSIKGHRVLEVFEVVEGEKKPCYRALVFSDFMDTIWLGRFTDSKRTAIADYTNEVLSRGVAR